MADEKILFIATYLNSSANIMKYLDQANFKSMMTNSLKNGIETITSFNPDVVLVSVERVEDMDINGINQLKRCTETFIPIIIIYNQEDEQNELNSLKAGVDTFLVFPLKYSTLINSIRDMITIKGLREYVHTLENQIKSSSQNVEDLEIIDPKTNFYRFKYLKKYLIIEIKRARRYRYPFSLLLLSYDNFRNLQEKYPRNICHQLFGGLSLLITKQIRDVDLPVSYSEENVMIVLPHTGLEGTINCAERLRTAMKKAIFQREGVSIQVKVSLGVAGMDDPKDLSFSNMILQATKALRKAKMDGGDRVCS